MKCTRVSSAVLKPALFFCLLLGYIAGGVAQAAQGYVQDATGEVKAAIGKGPARAVARNDTIADDTVFTTGAKSTAVLLFKDGQAITMQEHSSFHVQKYFYDEKDVAKSSIVFALLSGGIRAITGAIGQTNKDAFKLATATATIGVRGTEFVLVTLPNGQVVGQVVSGSISVTNAAGTVVMGPGATFSVSVGSLGVSIAPGAVPAGTFAGAPSFSIPGAITIPAAPAAGATGGAGAVGAAAGGGLGTAGLVGIAAAIAASAAAVASSSSTGTTLLVVPCPEFGCGGPPGTGTTGTTGSR